MDPAGFLRATPPFDVLPEPLFADAVAHLEACRFPAGTWISRAGGEPLHHLFVIRAGTVRLERHGQTVQVLEEGETFGFTSLMTGAAALDVIASMEPPHAVEDMGWAEQRLGRDRGQHAYAWRALRRSGARLVFNSDLPGTDYDIFYGLHSAITRRDKTGQPSGGWHPQQRMTAEEALRGYTTWAAYTAFEEKETGVLAPGRWADITVMDIDPLAIGEHDPDRLLRGRIEMTIVAGKVVYRR